MKKMKSEQKLTSYFVRKFVITIFPIIITTLIFISYLFFDIIGIIFFLFKFLTHLPVLPVLSESGKETCVHIITGHTIGVISCNL